MNIYSVYFKEQLVDQPDWLAPFRAKYDGAYDFHITLKQMAYIEEASLVNIKSILGNLIAATAFPAKRPCLTFDRVMLDEHDVDDGMGFIYLFAKTRNEFIDNLQKQIREQLSTYSNYYLSNAKTYEYDFKPHLTIARNLNSKSFAKAVKDLPATPSLTGEITAIVLSCVKELTSEEAQRPENFTTYSL
jgi:2'-5' RNA ligase